MTRRDTLLLARSCLQRLNIAGEIAAAYHYHELLGALRQLIIGRSRVLHVLLLRRRRDREHHMKISDLHRMIVSTTESGLMCGRGGRQSAQLEKGHTLPPDLAHSGPRDLLHDTYNLLLYPTRNQLAYRATVPVALTLLLLQSQGPSQQDRNNHGRSRAP